jgi:hypothetical protein
MTAGATLPRLTLWPDVVAGWCRDVILIAEAVAFQSDIET